MKRKLALNTVLVLILIAILITIFSKDNSLFQKEDILLFSSNYQNKDKSVKTYNCNIKESKKIEVNLLDTLSKNDFYQKVFPGSEGKFYIVINSFNYSKKTNYKLIFKSKGLKPQNLKFKLSNEKEEITDIEKTNNKITGVLNPFSENIIQVDWKWDYENENDIQDTLDGMYIDKYIYEILIEIQD